MHAMFLATLALTLAATGLSTAAGQGQQQERCFPQTGYCISGRFLTFWEQNGGLTVFGFPIGPAGVEQYPQSGQAYLSQWFERTRFEQHPENLPPYDVLLGRTGDDRLRRLGVNWSQLPSASGPRPGCLWFNQTGHNVCDQGDRLGFKSYWEGHGLKDPRLSPYGQSLVLFGYPLTEPRMETSPAGLVVLTQWFERARFEWHPDLPDEFKVLQGLLGNELHGGLETPGPMPTLPSHAPPSPFPTVGADTLSDVWYWEAVEPSSRSPAHFA
ncbi:MAG TPA: hypothetical protein VFM49_24795 [Chloroflexia bacterium]|nr:hypothetical protein [Chloroflexia bacterium]